MTESLPNPAPENEEKKTVYRKPLQKKEWAEIAALWSLGEARLRDLADRFKVAPETISRKMKKMGIKYGEKAEEHTRKVQEKVEAAAVDDASIIAERIRKTKEESYNNARLLQAAAVNVLAKANKDKVSLATTEPVLKAIERAIKINGMGLQQRWLILGLDKEDTDPDDLQDLPISEMTADQIEKAQRDAEIMASGTVEEDFGGLVDMEAEMDLGDIE